jgi:CO/xanthine dehydrogenase FAD-binding subunit
VDTAARPDLDLVRIEVVKAAPFAYVRPDTIAEVTALLARHGEDSRIIAGGQSLGAMLNMRLVTPAIVIDINRIVETARIEVEANFIRIGATVRQSDVMADERFASVPLLSGCLPHVGHYQTRNRGTICGSIAHADPSAELPLALLVSGGSVELRSARKSSVVAADDFFVSMLTTSREADQMIVATRWPKAKTRTGHSFEEFAIRSGDYAIVAAAAEVELAEDGHIVRLRVGLAGIGERPVGVDLRFTEGQLPSPDLLESIAESARRGIEPVTDLQATAEFRAHMAGVMARQVAGTAIERARKRGL